jgi:acetylornithine deacetylase/succinyl-diaminopimelate desuccinylase-like protein
MKHISKDEPVSADYQPEAEVVQLCQELIRIDTSNFGSDQGPGEREAAERVAELLADVGIESQLLEPEPRRTSVVAHWEPEGVDRSLSPLLVHGHLDVVPAKADDWSVPPFSGELVDGCLWGRGAVDMKHFDAMVLSVVRARARASAAPRRPLRMIFTADEEAGSGLGAKWLVEERPEVVEGCEEAIGEVGGFSLTVRDDLRLYLIQTAEKGMAWLNLIAEGRAGHGSLHHPDNAITELSAAVAKIGAYEWPQRITDPQRAFLEAVAEAFEIDLEPDHLQESLPRLGIIARLIGATISNTANPTMLSGGDAVLWRAGRGDAGVLGS